MKLETKQISGKKGAVGAGHAGSEEAGLRMLKDGGNAVDAGVASILALSVTDHSAFCFGGEVPILIYMAETEKVVAISGMGTAPQKASLEMFIGMDAIPGSGILPAAVPSVLATCVLALDQFGTMTFAEVAEPTIQILATKGGEDWFPRLANTFGRLIEAEKGSKDRNAGLEAVREHFYEGPIADEFLCGVSWAYRPWRRGRFYYALAHRCGQLVHQEAGQGLRHCPLRGRAGWPSGAWPEVGHCPARLEDSCLWSWPGDMGNLYPNCPSDEAQAGALRISA